MGVKSRKRGRGAVQSLAVVPQPTAIAGQTIFYGGGTSYFAAQHSDSRQRLILPHKDELHKLRAQDRTLMALKSRVFAENYGPGAALRHFASMIGSLKPQSISGDDEWSKIAEERFNQVTGSALSFDAGGRLTLPMWQVMGTYRALLDADCFTVFTRSPTTGTARLMGYEGLCVEQGKDCDTPNWIDGIECNPATRFPLRYCFVERNAKGETFNRILPGAVVHHHFTPQSYSARRGVPAFAHCLNNFQDIIETTAFQKQALKVAALIGLTPADESPMGPTSQMGVSSPLQRESIFLPPTTSATATLPATKVTFEQAMEGGLVSTRPMKTLHDGRPHPNGEEFKKTMLREAAIGLDMPPQLLYFMDDPGGAWTRVLLELAARTITNHHVNHLAPFVRRVWAYVVANEMRLGNIPEPSKGDWLKIKLTPPRMPTADLGKMGRLYIELRKTCLQSHRGIYEELGMDYEDEIDQCGREFKLMMDTEVKHGLPPGSLTNALLPMGQTVDSLNHPESQDTANSPA